MGYYIARSLTAGPLRYQGGVDTLLNALDADRDLFTAELTLTQTVPGEKYTFGVVKAAQARGDFEVLIERQRRALRVHLGANPGAGLETLLVATRNALT